METGALVSPVPHIPSISLVSHQRGLYYATTVRYLIIPHW